MRKSFLLGAAAAAFVSLGAAAPHAAPVSFEFEGTMLAPPGPLAGAFTAGDPFTVSVTVESTTADTDADPNRGFYPDSILSFIFMSGPHTISMTPTSFVKQTIVSDTGVPDEIQFTAVDFGGFTGGLINGWLAESFNLDFTDLAGTAVSGDAIPATIDPLDFDAARRLDIRFRGLNTTNQTVFLQGVIESSGRTTMVSEPAALALFGLGMIGLGYLARRRRDGGTS